MPERMDFPRGTVESARCCYTGRTALVTSSATNKNACDGAEELLIGAIEKLEEDGWELRGHIQVTSSSGNGWLYTATMVKPPPPA